MTWGVVGMRWGVAVNYGHPPARCARVPLRFAKGGGVSHSHQFAFPLKYLHELQSFPSFPILRILVQKKTPRCFHGGVFFLFPSSG